MTRWTFATFAGVLMLCAPVARSQQPVYFAMRGVTWPACETVSDAFTDHVRHILADSANMFPEYPVPVPLTCELLAGLRDALTDDSARYHFEHLAQRYWRADPHYANAARYIDRHLDFHLAIAATGHFFADVRIMGLRELQRYRNIRPLVCTTKEGSARLEKQDRQAVRYLVHVLEETPWRITGSENATIHDVYINEIVQTLDLFTGQFHPGPKDARMRQTIPDDDLRAAMADWKKWLAQ